ncbi:Phenylalanine--tRNA ligase beta subunit [Serratia symbiotica]|nr:Phenylalanine--tRNA ligase beta subunit [Serratia symbiotica]
MKFSEFWLREWINIDINTQTLSEQMTMIGLEVDNIEPISNIFYDIIVGEIIECINHPNSKEFYITKVHIGNNKLLKIFCNAKNCRYGLKVAVATAKSILPYDFKIKKIKLYNEVSEGLLCSFSEIGIPNMSNNIIELPKDAKIGTNIHNYLQLHDNIITINVTPNRADCLSIIGIARDISAFNKIKFIEPNIKSVTTTINDLLPVYIDIPHACPRYLCRIVKNINIKAITPFWMREKLRRCGIHSINAVVDITNYVLLELGQPMHAFDLNCIEGSIIVRMAKKGETLILLNNKKAKFNNDTIVISDNNKILAMGGIFGGKYSKINKKTQNIIFESAFFNPLYIIGRAYQQGIYTDSAHRFERGVDPLLQYKAIERATHLLIDICGGKAGPIIDHTNKKTLPKFKTIYLHRKKINNLLGYIIPNKQIIDILYHLGFKVIKKNDKWLIVTPSWRFDIKIEEDIIEEIARIYGYSNIPNIPLNTNLTIIKNNKIDNILEHTKILLTNHGFQEIITYSFVDPKIQILIHPYIKALTLPNPISITMSVMRLSLWTGLLSTVIYNQNRQQTRFRIFENGLCFIPNIKSNLNINQNMMLGGLISGYVHTEHWDIKPKLVDFYDLKGEVESIFNLIGNLSDINFKEENNPALHPKQSMAIYLYGKRIGFIGMIHPEIKYKLNLNHYAFLFELEWNNVINLNNKIKIQEISRFPSNRRDISIIIDEKISVENILKICRNITTNHVVDINLFDVYRGKDIKKGYKSISISFILQNTHHTLKEKEITTTIEKYIEILKKQFQASLRD